MPILFDDMTLNKLYKRKCKCPAQPWYTLYSIYTSAQQQEAAENILKIHLKLGLRLLIEVIIFSTWSVSASPLW